MRRLAHPTGPVVYQSDLLSGHGIPHGFTTRLGGVSPAPFGSLNLGLAGGCAAPDLATNLAENRRRVLEAIGCSDRLPVAVRQVHGCEVVELVGGKPTGATPETPAGLPGAAGVDGGEGHAWPGGQAPQADALVSADRSRVISVRVADCVPILVATEDGSVVCAIHAGWRGVAANVVGAAVIRLRGQAPTLPLVAAVGPHIGFEAFEVGPEVTDALRSSAGRFAGVATTTANTGSISGPRSRANCARRALIGSIGTTCAPSRCRTSFTLTAATAPAPAEWRHSSPIRDVHPPCPTRVAACRLGCFGREPWPFN